MASRIETLVRTVRGLTDDRRFESWDDPEGLLLFSPKKLETYRMNPFLSDWDQPCQLIGVQGGKVVGRRNSFPSRIVAEGRVYNTRISGSVYVDPRCRSSLYAISLLKQAFKFPDGDLNINCWMSEQNQKFYKLLGSVMLELIVFEAGGRWSRYCRKVKFKHWWKNAAAKVLNQLAAVTCFCFDCRRYAGVPSWKIIETPDPDENLLRAAVDLLRDDVHPYRQEITPEWIRWTLKYDFYADECEKHFIAVNEGTTLVGFALVRYGAKDKVNKIYEWQLARAYEAKEAEFLTLVAKRIYRYGCRVQIAVGKDSVTTIEKLSLRFPRTHGNYAAVTMSGESRFKAFPGIQASANWRVRPGMGDGSLW